MKESRALTGSIGGLRDRPAKEKASLCATMRWSKTEKYSRAASPSMPRTESSSGVSLMLFSTRRRCSAASCRGAVPSPG